MTTELQYEFQTYFAIVTKECKELIFKTTHYVIGMNQFDLKLFSSGDDQDGHL